MPAKNSAPKGKGKVSPKKKPTTISRKTKTPLQKPKPKEPVITMDQALKFLQSQGVEITEKTIDQLAQLAKIPTIYTGKPGDASLHLKRRMLQALEQTLGIVTTAAELAGISRQAHYEWLERDEEYRDATLSLGDVALDMVESQLHKNIKEGREASAIFYMKTKGKKRGYIETVHNMNQNFDGNNVHYYVPDNGRDGIVEDAKVIE